MQGWLYRLADRVLPPDPFCSRFPRPVPIRLRMKVLAMGWLQRLL